MSADLTYDSYWRRKHLLAGSVPRFPVRRWWATDGLSEIERIYFELIKDASSVLDVGAGDLRVKRKFQRAGFRGEYHTLDVGTEYEYTYRNLTDVTRSYGAILSLDVIEHLNLESGLQMLRDMVGMLDNNGVLIIQTPNARCVRNPLGWDMTHLHCYNITDLWTYLTCQDLVVQGYRVVFGGHRRSPLSRLQHLAARYIATKLLGGDYADNIVLIAHRASAD